jgi:hypothetical protein
MTDAEYGPDRDQHGEELDEAVGDEYPPDRPPRLDDTGGYVPEAWETDEAELVGTAVDEGDAGPLAPDDEFTGDETTRDYATEREPRSAEEAAVHVLDEDDVV